jgi:hypothetical protein
METKPVVLVSQGSLKSDDRRYRERASMFRPNLRDFVVRPERRPLSDCSSICLYERGKPENVDS